MFKYKLDTIDCNWFARVDVFIISIYVCNVFVKHSILYFSIFISIRYGQWLYFYNLHL